MRADIIHVIEVITDNPPNIIKHLILNFLLIIL